MDDQKIPDITPQNEKGKQNDLEHKVLADTIEEAEELFLAGKDRLLSINNWHDYAGELSGVFVLTDNHGKELHRKAHKGDYLKINLPGPGESAGDGYDWVHVETIQYDDYPDSNSETIAMTVRPTQAPVNNDKNTAHFFSDDATSTFSIQRKGKEVIATYHGRNEVPNTGTDNLIDKARNAVVALGAMIGISELQWKSLIKGFLTYEGK
ncbi:MAG: hypothetical protein EOP56_14115 [Sphingobacteriales bacterium]|nr:MAG: hypothetical protein EOP56_14115 [Sphingobacteriales bacterium]